LPASPPHPLQLLLLLLPLLLLLLLLTLTLLQLVLLPPLVPLQHRRRLPSGGALWRMTTMTV